MKKREFIESVRSLLDEYDGVKPVFTHKITIPLETLDMAPNKILSESDLVDWIDNLVMSVHGDKPQEKAKDGQNSSFNNFLSEGKLNIFNEDALDFLPKLENESIDLIYCDLPFGTTQCSWDEVIPFDKMWEQVIRIAKQNTPIVFHAQQPFTSALIMSNPKMFKYTWVWEKSKATGFLNAKKRPLVAHEDIVVFCKGTPVYYPKMTEGVAYNKGVRKQQTENDVYGSFEQVEVKSDGLRYPRSVQYFKTAESEGKTWHKTQKPKDLCKYIIETYSKQGDVVLDFTAGSGTTAIGVEIGRTVVLVEKKLNEFEKLKERWEEKIIKTD